MAVLALSTDLSDMRERLGRMVGAGDARAGGWAGSGRVDGRLSCGDGTRELPGVGGRIPPPPFL